MNSSFLFIKFIIADEKLKIQYYNLRVFLERVDILLFLYGCTLGVFLALAFVADFPPVAPEFHQRTHRVRLKNLGTTDKKSSHKIKYKKIPRVHIAVCQCSFTCLVYNWVIKMTGKCYVVVLIYHSILAKNHPSIQVKTVDY